MEEHGIKIDEKIIASVAHDIAFAVECERECFSYTPPNPMIEELKQKDRKIKEMEDEHRRKMFELDKSKNDQIRDLLHSVAYWKDKAHGHNF